MRDALAVVALAVALVAIALAGFGVGYLVSILLGGAA